MAAMTDEGLSGDEMDDLLNEVTAPETTAVGKKSAIPVRRTDAQIKAAEARAIAQAEANSLRAAADAKKARAAQLAQIVNLHIAGFSLADIGASTGHSEAEIERMLSEDMARYVRTQPALRTYVRNYISGKYTELLETVWDRATDATHQENLDAQDRAVRILDRMGRLHGAEAPVQSEVKVEQAPEAVERIVSALAATQGLGYDMNVFDVVPSTVVHEATQQSLAALESASREVERPQEGDGDGI